MSNNNKIKCILITGTRRTGKDTFFALLNQLDSKFQRVSFADALKDELNQFILSNFNIHIHSVDGEDKEKIRSLMIGMGEARRNFDPEYWIKQGYAKAGFMYIEENIPVIVDVRYINEYNYFKDRFGDELVLIAIKRQDGVEPTPEEKINGPEVEKYADFVIDWPTVDGRVDELIPYVEEFYEKFIK